MRDLAQQTHAAYRVVHGIRVQLNNDDVIGFPGD